MSLVEKALELALKRHGISQRRIWIRDKTHPFTGVTEVGRAIKLLTLFPQDSKLSHRNASSICNILANSTHLTPGPAYTENIKLLYFQSRKLVGSAATRPHPNFREAHEWVQTEVERKVKEWVEVGVSTEDLLELVHRARRGGNKLNSDTYTEIFKVCLCIQYGCGSHVTPPLRSLLELIVADCGGDVARDILFSSSFHVVTSEHKLKVVSKLMGEISKSTPLIYHKEQLSASLSVDVNADKVVNVFTQYLLKSDTPPSMFVYEEMLSLCAMRYQLRWAINIFNSMTTKHRIAPSRNVYNILTLLMTSRISSGDVTKELCHRILSETMQAYCSRPPLWVFTELTKPLVHLMGLEGYHAMYSKCEARLDEMNVSYPKAKRNVLRSAWRPSLYLTLIKAAVATDNQDLGLHMLSEMRGWGHIINSRVYMLLLQLLRRRDDLHFYLPVLLKGMNCDLPWTSSIAKQLHRPLTSSLRNIVKEQTLLEVPGFIETVAMGLLDSALTSSSQQSCIRHLEGLSVACKETNYTESEKSTQYEYPIQLAQ